MPQRAQALDLAGIEKLYQLWVAGGREAKMAPEILPGARRATRSRSQFGVRGDGGDGGCGLEAFLVHILEDGSGGGWRSLGFPAVSKGGGAQSRRADGNQRPANAGQVA